jgi:hypothetical protein
MLNSFLLLPSQCISIADHLLELRATTTPTKENTKVHSQKLTKQSESRLLEDFNVYGAGGDLDSPTEGHDELGFPHRNQEFEETAALLNPDNSNQSGLHVQSRPASVSSTGPPSAPPTLKTVDGGDDGSEQTNKSTSRGSRLLSSATPGLSRRKLFSYRQLSA